MAKECDGFQCEYCGRTNTKPIEATSKEPSKHRKYPGTFPVKGKCGIKWKAMVTENGKSKYLGMFLIEEVAALAVAEHHGRTEMIEKLRSIIEDKKQAEMAEPGIANLKGPFTWRWECKGCGEGYGQVSIHTLPDKCDKCNSRQFEKIKVLKQPDSQIGGRTGWHNE